ncbi:MAG: thioredoxin [Simkaniaceae bacterium]|nr:thioredoxin [Simkaniaceae bacterium]
MSEIENLTDENFEATIKEGVTLVDFYADWCGPCRMLAPVIEEVAGEMGDKAKFAKIDIDQHQKTASTMQVTSVPTVVLFKDGKEVNRLVGLRDADGIRQFVGSA